MKDYGVADVRVQFTNRLKNIDRKRNRYNFDVRASQWPSIDNSLALRPIFIEYLADPNGTLHVLFPSRRVGYIDNFLRNADGSIGTENNPIDLTTFNKPVIIWKPTVALEENTFMYTQVKTLKFFGYFPDDNPPQYTLLQPGNYDNNILYEGPIWSFNTHPREASSTQSDIAFLKHKFSELDAKEEPEESEEPEETSEEVEPIQSLSWVHQTRVKDGLWWGIESEPFLEENMPFYIFFKKMKSPSSAIYPTFLVISLGLSDNNNRYDIVLANQKKSAVVDYQIDEKGDIPHGSSSTVAFKSVVREFEATKLFDYEEDVEIGIMTIGGRLVITIGKEEVMVYQRIHNRTNENIIDECKIAQGAIRIYGTNIMAGINVSAMRFAPIGQFALSIATIVNKRDSSQDLIYVGTEPDGRSTYGQSTREVCELPQPTSAPSYGAGNGILFGVDCFEFRGEVKKVRPRGFGFHQDGIIDFLKGKDTNLESLKKTDLYVVIMRPDRIIASTYLGFDIINAGCPYFFRLKGEADVELQSPDTSLIYNATNSLVSVQETVTNEDMSYTKKTATITLYNEGGQWDFLRNKMYGVEIAFGWNSPDPDLTFSQKTFTGLTIGAETSETPGSELITIQCEDYINILDNVPIINSPFYDGMVAFYALQDIAKRGGVVKINRSWEGESDYFLPSGFAFSQPAMRFESTRTLTECMVDICKRFQAFFYFDEDGELWLEYIPGGIIGGGNLGGTGGSVLTIVERFVSDPNNSSGLPVIIDSRELQENLNSTVNKIVILTVDRETRNAIVVGHSANPSDDKLEYDKPLMLHQPAYGELNVARNIAYEYGDRVFHSIKKTTFKTVGGTASAAVKIYPLDFITLDGQEFRVTNITRSFNAETNDYTSEYTCEALGL